MRGIGEACKFFGKLFLKELADFSLIVRMLVWISN